MAEWSGEITYKPSVRDLIMLAGTAALVALVLWLALPAHHGTGQPPMPSHGCVTWDGGRDIMCAQP